VKASRSAATTLSSPKPSMVRIEAPSQLPAWTMQERAGAAPISTVQAPQTPSRHNQLGGKPQADQR
jgi:hypothetical protein